LFALLLVGMVVARVIAPRLVPAPPQKGLYTPPMLTLIDQEGEAFSTAQLLGHPWVADFFFASCPGACPIMQHQMEDLQAKLPASVSLVSFTVDPKTDTPAILKGYGQSYHADFSRWHFLTGTPQQMTDAAHAMAIGFTPSTNGIAIAHSQKFLLLDAGGNVVGIYEGTDSQEVAKLVADASKLAQESH
jgi:protein SCO1/2